jgi:hypothetical protein
MNSTSKKLIAAFAMLVLASCSQSPQPQAESLPGMNIAPENINTFIEIRDTPELANSHKNNDTLTLQLINLTDQTIDFPDNYGIKVFTKDQGKWTEIQNNFYNAGGTFTLPSAKQDPGGLPPTVLPYIPGLPSSTTIRVIIVGHVENNDSKQVGAYLDVVINP